MTHEYGAKLFYNQAIDLMIDYRDVAIKEINRDRLDRAFAEMETLERGAIANPDENRMVGHYWLRNPNLAPTTEIKTEIERCIATVTQFAQTAQEEQFTKVLVIGIGGSALGPRFISTALKSKDDAMELYFLDNTDPMGMDRLFDELQADLVHCLVVVISKSGSTVETRNGLIETKQFFVDCGLDFSKQAVSISQADSILDRMAQVEGWRMRVPMWDWVGGRTSVFSAVGLLPLALQGVDIAQLLAGARDCDAVTRKREQNPAALLACLWYTLVEEQGLRQMVLLPYKDSLGLFTQYCQQLIMESIGKKFDRQGHIVHKGFAVWGNKGATDQHSFVQQLLEGENNFFTVFVQIWKEREKTAVLVGENSSGGDYLQAFLLGTEKALSEAGRQSMILSLPEVNAYYLGVLIALFERAVGLFASLLNVNAYNQPGVERGKKCATEMIALKNRILMYLAAHGGRAYTVSELQSDLELEDGRVLLHLLLHLAANKGNQIESSETEDLFKRTFWFVAAQDLPHR